MAFPDVKSGSRKLAAIAAAMAGAIVLSGCSSDSVRDAFGLTKDAPNENLVKVNQPLALPPDYVLRAPNSSQPAREPGYSLPPAPQLPTKVPPPGSITAQPPTPKGPAYPPASQLPPVQTANAGGIVTQQGPLQTARPVPIGGQQPTAAPAKPKDIYERWGVSKVNPDGTPKTPEQLREELRQKSLAKKRAADPKWGTWRNVWSAVFGK